jgi:propionyl-CoA synthetase
MTASSSGANESAAQLYRTVHETSLTHPDAFWLDAARAIDWTVQPAVAFDPHRGAYGRWFPDGVANTCYNAVDRHVRAGQGERGAIIYESPVDGRSERISYRMLLEEVETLSAVLVDRGVGRGDRVLIYMPMIPQALYAMLACARIGAVHSVVFGGFAPAELASRIDDATPALILSASCGIEPGRVIPYKPLLDEALQRSEHRAVECIVFQRDRARADLRSGRDHDWAELVAQARAAGRSEPCVPLSSLDPLYILYTSGTTGRPKGVVRDTGGHMVALAWSMSAIYGIGAGDVFWAASDIGWVVGHSYIVYGPLLVGATTVLYEGKPVGTPDVSAFPRLIAAHDVKVLFTAPTALRAVRREDPDGAIWNRHAAGRLQAIFLAGERADTATLSWCETALRIDAVDHWWQTETGWAIAANPAGLARLPTKPGSAGVAMPGYRLKIVDAEGQELPAGTSGNIVLQLPLPPGSLPTLWQDDQRFEREYFTTFAGHYCPSDRGYVDDEGYLFVEGRTDDVINVAGHRLSTGVFEEIIARHPTVAECAVVGAADALKGEVPIGFVVFKREPEDLSETIRSIVQHVRDEFGPVGAFRTIYPVAKLPKTRSGKILRGLVRNILNGADWAMPAVIEDPRAVDDLLEAIKAHRE